MYFGDDELGLLRKIEENRGHVSRSAWMKEAAEAYLGNERKTAVKVESDFGLTSSSIDNFLDSMN